MGVDGTPRALGRIARQTLAFVGDRRNHKVVGPDGLRRIEVTADDLRRIELCALAALDISLFDALYGQKDADGTPAPPQE